MVGPDSEHLPLQGCIEKTGSAAMADAVPAWYHTLNGTPSHADFEGLVGHAVIERVPVKGAFTMDNSLQEMKDHSLIMRIMYKIVRNTVARGFPKGTDERDLAFRLTVSSAVDGALRGLKISGGMNNHLLEGMLEIANGHPFRGLLMMLR